MPTNSVFPQMAALSMPVYQPLTNGNGLAPSFSGNAAAVSSFPFSPNGFVSPMVNMGQLMNQSGGLDQFGQSTAIASFLALQAQLSQKNSNPFNIMAAQTFGQLPLIAKNMQARGINFGGLFDSKQDLRPDSFTPSARMVSEEKPFEQVKNYT